MIWKIVLIGHQAEQLRNLMSTLQEDSRLASSTDISGWSPSQKRLSWRHLHAMLAGSTGQNPESWWLFLRDLRYVSNSMDEETDRIIPMVLSRGSPSFLIPFLMLRFGARFEAI